MIVRFALIACLFASAAAPVLAQDNAAATQTATPEGHEKKVCETDVDTASIIPHRVCHTKAEWADIARENAKNNDQFGDQTRRHSGGFGH